MAFIYNSTPPVQANLTPTVQSKQMLVKSFVINIANGSPATTATAYTVATLPKGAQVVGGLLLCPTALSGGTVSAATIAISVGGYNVWANHNVFTTSITVPTVNTYYTNLANLPATDQTVQYTFTLTGANPTAGLIYVNIYYVV